MVWTRRDGAVVAGEHGAGVAADCRRRPGDRPPPLPPQAINYAAPPPPGHYRDIGDDPKMRMLLPVGRSPWAIVAGYLGLLSPLMIFAPFALIVSIIAMRDIKRHNTTAWAARSSG